MWFIYILECTDGSFYIGSTNNIEQRFKNHIAGKGAKYTKSHKPVRIIYKKEFLTKSEAFKREWELKKFSRKQKEQLIKLQSLQPLSS